MRILLVRHGESIANIDQSVYVNIADHAIPLSEEGLNQAKAAGLFINSFYQQMPKPPKLIRIWTSPYERARQTAEMIAKKIHKIKFDLKEHINLCEQQFGLFDGVPEEEWAERFPEEYNHYKKCEDQKGRFWARMPLGESRFDVAVRVHQAFGTFHRDADWHNTRDIIVICHGVTLRAFVMQWLHLTPEWFDSESNPVNCAIRLIENGKDKGYIYNA